MNADEIKQLADKYKSRMVEYRRHLHQYPELSYREYETTSYIRERLAELDIPTEQPLDTGCIGIIQGRKEDGDVIALRADIDALAIEEEGEHKKEFLSRHKGIAHCCGHDAHTANLLGAAHILSDLRDEITGKILLIFQPGEEKLPGGGRLLCENGFLQKQGVDVIYGLHTSPFYEPGQIGVRNGALMARPDEFEVEVIGSGGHAASPQSAVDPIVIASEVVSALQTVVSRNVDPNEPAVVTVGKIEGGTAHNIIPERVRLWGTVRTFSKETADLINERMQSIIEGITGAHGADYHFEFNTGYPAVDNTDWAVDRLRDVGTRLLGESGVVEVEDPVLAGEDFAFYQQYFPGAFFFLGTGSEESDSRYTWHHPRYNIDENALPAGAAVMASLGLEGFVEG